MSEATLRRDNDANAPSNIEHLHGHGGVGPLLKASRIRVDEEVEDVASALRISTRYIEAIEQGRFDSLPGRTYANGFVRAYADHLGLDADEVVRRFKLESEDGQKAPDLHFPEPIPESKVPGAAIVLIGVVLAVAAYGGWYVMTGKNEPATEAVQPAPEVTASADGTAATAAAEDASATDAGTADDTAGAAAQAADAASEPETAAAEPAAEPAASDATGESVAATESQAPADEPAAPEPAVEPSAAAETAPPPEPEIAAAPEPATEPATAVAPEPAVPAAETEAPATETAEAPAGAATEPEPAAEPVEEAAVSVTEIAAPVAEVPAPPAETATVETAAIPAPEKKPAEAANAEPAPDPAAGETGIVLTATASSWVQIRDETTGETVVTKVLRVGDSVTVPDRPNLTLLTGNAGGLEIRVDGVAAPAIGEPGEIVRDVSLIGERLLAGTATR